MGSDGIRKKHNRYEEIIYIGGERFAPDFKIRKNEGFVFWEHCGMVKDERYMKRHKHKIEVYEQNGIVPWKNLIITYDDEDGNVDTRIIESEIVNKLL